VEAVQMKVSMSAPQLPAPEAAANVVTFRAFLLRS